MAKSIILSENKAMIHSVMERDRRDGRNPKNIRAISWTLSKFFNNINILAKDIPEEAYHEFLDKFEGSPNTHNAYMITLNKLRAVLGKPRLDRKYRKGKPKMRLNLKKIAVEYQRLYNAADNDRDRVILALLRYGGLRAGELVTLKRKNFEIHDEYIILRFYRPKTNINSEIVLVEPVGLIAKYLENGNFKDDDFILTARKTKQYPSGVLKYAGLTEIIWKLCEKTGISFHSHLFRHFRATELARTKSMNKWDLDNVFGWSHQSKTANVYVDLAESETRDKMLEHAGLKTEESAEKIHCRRCGIIIPSEETYCQRCGLPVNPAEALKETAKNIEIKSEIGELRQYLKDMEKALHSAGISVVGNRKTKELAVFSPELKENTEDD